MYEKAGEKEYITYIEKKSQAPAGGSGSIREALLSQFDIKVGGSIVTRPLVYDGVLYLGANDTYLYALDAASGLLLWKFKTGDLIWHYAAAADGIIYLRSRDMYVYALSAADGSLIWKQRVGAPFGGSPVVANGALYVGTGSGVDTMYAFDARSGNIQWTFKANGPVQTPSLANNTLFFGCGDKCMYALDAATGSLKWKFMTSDGIDSIPAITNSNGDEVWSVHTQTLHIPTVTNGMLYFGSWDNHVYALTLDGKEQWRYRTDGPIIFSSPTVYKGILYVGSFDQHLYALDTQTGTLKWRFRTGGAVTADPLVCHETIYVGSVDSCLHAVSLDGKEQWKFRTGGYISAAATVWNDTVYFGSWDCNLYALSLHTRKPVWNFRTGAKYESQLSTPLPTVIDQINEMNRRIYRLWKPETRSTVFADHVSLSHEYRMANQYAAKSPYQMEQPPGYAGEKPKTSWERMAEKMGFKPK
ncbi:MAG: PQQ-binding-like beta-propeller repeat protein [Candidatus Aenigmarchaeota archaeon]|nr:PQQ-binding-like beta-propeller repeat protein [Candidatus Aenigmarchaeota archaeon]